jgi:bifunctional UDP-N-acetylglucosamine pyrophosphorylase/glucosamine-1-phosphate N-acetyltransferase
MLMKDLIAVVLAAGKGTRMQSRTPKVLHRLLREPLLFYPLQLLDELGVGRTLVVVSGDQDGDLVSNSFPAFPQLEWPRQMFQKGTADAVAAALEQLSGVRGELLILCGDVPLLRRETVARFYRAHKESGAGLSVLTAVLEDGGAYGRVLVDEKGSPTAIVEARDASSAELEVRRINSGTYLVDLELLRQALTATDCDNAQGEYYLTDMVAFARRHGVKVSCLDVDDPDEILGVNTRADLVHLESLLAGRIAERWLGRGVTIRSPETVRIGPRVRLDPEVEIEPGAALFGEVTIGRGSLIGTGAQLQDTWVGAGVEIKAYSVLEEAAVAAGAQIGPFARLRPGTEIGPDAKIGNFVETKKAVFGRGAKASHLAYIGDAEVGEESNLGAGTITCNYDGFNKFRTVIGKGVFIGSDTQLVAPVEIGDDALVGAGSTITRKVAANSLATSRGRQKELADRGMAWRREREKK